MVTTMRYVAVPSLLAMLASIGGCNVDHHPIALWNIWGLFMGPGVLQGEVGVDDGITWDGQGVVPKEVFSAVADLETDAPWEAYQEIYREYDKVLVHPQPYAIGSTNAGDTFELECPEEEGEFYMWCSSWGEEPWVDDNPLQVNLKVYDYQWPTDDVLAEFSLTVSWHDCKRDGITTDVGGLTNYAVIRVAGSCDQPK